jgi:ribosomal protein S18 acetylase RimI-like enzyme
MRSMSERGLTPIPERFLTSSLLSCSLPGDGALALLQDELIVGLCEFGSTEDTDDDPSRTGQVFRLYVDPLLHGRGGGRLLLEAACDHLRAAAREDVTLWVLESDPRARGFYERLGWRNDGGRKRSVVVDLRYRLEL